MNQPSKTSSAKSSLRLRISRRWFQSARSSLIAIVLALQLFGALPLSLLFCTELYTDGALTAGSAFAIALVTASCFALAGFLFWLTFAEPLRRRVEARSHEGGTGA